MPFRPDRLKALREAKELSQEQLGELAGLHHSVITKSEKGKNLPRSEALDKLATALDCTMDYLHGRGSQYESPAVAAAHMAFDVFVEQHGLTDEQREQCRRVLVHPDAPKTASKWHSLAEILGLALESAAAVTSPTFLEERLARSKPMSVSRRFHRRS